MKTAAIIILAVLTAVMTAGMTYMIRRGEEELKYLKKKVREMQEWNKEKEKKTSATPPASNKTKEEMRRLRNELRPTGYRSLLTGAVITLEDIETGTVNIDHITPRAKKGRDTKDNRILVEKTENVKKGDNYIDEYIRKKGMQREYVEMIKTLEKGGTMSKQKLSNLKRNHRQLKKEAAETTKLP